MAYIPRSTDRVIVDIALEREAIVRLNAQRDQLKAEFTLALAAINREIQARKARIVRQTAREAAPAEGATPAPDYKPNPFSSE